MYATIKDADAHVQFVFLTGVSKFSEVNLFSELNNLTDITLDPNYSAVCGYTDSDLDTVFDLELDGPKLDGPDRQAVRDRYNGYSRLGGEKVYNPFDVLLLFRNRRFGAYRFETGTPKFLVDTLIIRCNTNITTGLSDDTTTKPVLRRQIPGLGQTHTPVSSRFQPRDTRHRHIRNHRYLTSGSNEQK